MAVGSAVGLPIRAAATFRAGDARDPVDYGGALLVEFETSDERSDELTTLVPVDVIQPGSHLVGEVTQAADDGGELHALRDLLLGLLELLTRPTETYADTFAARDEVIEFKGSSLVRVAQAPQDLLLSRDHLFCVVSLRADLGDGPVLGSSPRPLLDHLTRILENAAHGIPYVTIELIHADLWVVTHASAVEAVRVAADAAVVGVPHGLALSRPQARLVCGARSFKRYAHSVTMDSKPLFRELAPSRSAPPGRVLVGDLGLDGRQLGFLPNKALHLTKARSAPREGHLGADAGARRPLNVRRAEAAGGPLRATLDPRLAGLRR